MAEGGGFDPETTDLTVPTLTCLGGFSVLLFLVGSSMVDTTSQTGVVVLALCVLLMLVVVLGSWLTRLEDGAPKARAKRVERTSGAVEVFLRGLDQARVRSGTVDGRIPGGGPRVEVRCHEFRIDLAVELPAGTSTSIDLMPGSAPFAVSGPRAGFARGVRGALAFLLQTWRARRVWTEDGWLRLSIPVDPSAVTPMWVDKLLQLSRVLLLALDEVPPLLAGAVPAEAFAPDDSAVARAAVTLVGRALGARLESARVERQGVDEVVSGRHGESGVTVRLSPGSVTVLSFTIPWRAGFDFDAAALPPDVLARVQQGGDSTGLSDPDAALVDLFGPLGCVRLHAHARRAHATLRRDSRLTPAAWVELALGIPARLEGLARSPVVMIGQRAPDPESGPPTCPYCKDAADGEGVTPCASCGTLHHTECFGEAGGCTVLGCASAPRRLPPVRA